MDANSFRRYFNEMYELYDYTMKSGDKRTNDWFMVRNPIPVVIAITGYMLIVFLGPSLMINRKPYNVKNTLVCYNFFLVALNSYFVFTCVSTYLKRNYNWICQHIDDSSFHPDDIKLAETVWYYYTSKVIDFMDTVFFILRKKNDQLTFLHVYHHASVIALLFVLTKWTPGGVGVIIVIINSMVHAIMYTYYGLAAMGPKVHKYLWWKKYLTMFQLTQFAIIVGIAVNGIVSGETCRYPLWTKYIVFSYVTTFLFLFGHFYVLAYWKGKRLLPSTKVNALDSAANGSLKVKKIKDGGNHSQQIGDGDRNFKDGCRNVKAGHKKNGYTKTGQIRRRESLLK